MTVRTFLIGSLLTTIIAAAIWILIVMFLDPTQAGLPGYILFFLSLFLWVAGLAALVGYGARRLLQAEQLPAYTVRNAMRQGLMVALFLTVLLMLVRLRLYHWGVAVVLIVVCVSAELVFLSYDRSLKRGSRPAAPRR